MSAGCFQEKINIYYSLLVAKIRLTIRLGIYNSLVPEKCVCFIKIWFLTGKRILAQATQTK